MLRCLKDGCPWECGTRRAPACAERMMTYGLGLALLLTLVVTVIVGVVSISKAGAGADVSFPISERAAVVGSSQIGHGSPT